MLPPFEPRHRLRPVALVAPHTMRVDLDGEALHAECLAGRPLVSAGLALPSAAPYVAAEAHLAPPGRGAGRLEISLVVGGWVLAGWWEPDTGRTGLRLAPPDGPAVDLRSRRHGRAPASSGRLGLTLTGPLLTLLVHDGETWVARARSDLAELAGAPDVHDPDVLAGIRLAMPAGDAGVQRLRAGAFGQLGLRDVRVVTEADGSPLWSGRRLWLTATHAGPGFARAAHAGTWLLDPESGELEHTGDLFVRRPSPRRPGSGDGVHGDHAVHLVHDDGRWLVAATTWDELGPAPRRRPPEPGAVGCMLATTREDPRRGSHVLDGAPLRLPAGPRAVGAWDAHLVRPDGPDGPDGPGGGWTVGYVEATGWFRFHPAVAAGPLDDLRLRAADPTRVATEGTTLVRVPGRRGGRAALRLLASDGPDSAPGRRRRFPVLDLDLDEVGALEAPYPSNIPWPSIARDDDRWWMVTFDGEPRGGALAGYGTHGDLHVLESARVPAAPGGSTLTP